MDEFICGNCNNSFSDEDCQSEIINGLGTCYTCHDILKAEYYEPSGQMSWDQEENIRADNAGIHR